MNNLTIAFDIDGTLTDPYYILHKANKIYGTNYVDSDFTSYAIKDVFGHEVDFTKEVDGLTLEEWFLRTPFDLEKIELIKGLTRLGIRVIIVTARGDEGVKKAKELFTTLGLEDIEIYQSTKQEPKGKILSKLKARLIVEDSPYEAIEIPKYAIDVLLLKRYYNEGLTLEGASYVSDDKLKERLEGILGINIDGEVDFKQVEENMVEECNKRTSCAYCPHRALCAWLGIKRATRGVAFYLSEEYERCQKVIRLIKRGEDINGRK